MENKKPGWGWRGKQRSAGSHHSHRYHSAPGLMTVACLDRDTTQSRKGREKHPSFSHPPTLQSLASASHWLHPAGSLLVQDPRKCTVWGKCEEAWIWGLRSAGLACSLCLSFLICKMGVITLPTLPCCWEDYMRPCMWSPSLTYMNNWW